MAFRTTSSRTTGVTVIQRGGAEAGLEAETSKNLTFGTVFQPTLGPAFGNLSLAVDYFRVEVNNGVSQLGAGTIARGCYNDTRPEYCQFVSRAPFTGPGTGALTITQTYINVATDIVKGIDFTLRYDRELGPGKLDIGVQAVRIIDRINQTDPDSDPFDFAVRSAIRSGPVRATSDTIGARGMLAGVSITSRARTIGSSPRTRFRSGGLRLLGAGLLAAHGVASLRAVEPVQPDARHAERLRQEAAEDHCRGSVREHDRERSAAGWLRRSVAVRSSSTHRRRSFKVDA